MNQVEDELIETIQSEEEDKETEVPIYKIISYPSDPTLEVLHGKFKRGEIIIPPFQRGWVWKPIQASRLIESFLLGLPVPAIFIYKETAQKQIVIDGQQRLRTIHGFFEGKLPDGTAFYLRGVSPQWEGKFYATLNGAEQTCLRDSVLREVIVEQVDPRDDTSIYYIFERLNTGGTGLTPQEVRNSTYHGMFNDGVIDLNKDAAWRHIFGSDVADARMRDIELIVRFLALSESADAYTKPMKQFLNTFMAKHKSDKTIEPYGKKFVDTVTRVHEALGTKPFHIRRGINVAAFDSVMVAFSSSAVVPKDIAERFRTLKANPSYLAAISSGTTDVDTVKGRIKLAQEILFK